MLDATCRDDLQQIVQIAGWLAIGSSTDESAVREFIDRAVHGAGEHLLDADDGVAWDRVTTALFRRSFMTSDEVRSIVAEIP